MLIRQGVTAAIKQTLEPAATERAYPGHFTIVADGHWFGQENTWPGLDSWQMAGAYLLLGRTQLVRDYFDYVQASQRADGNIPYAIVSADTPPDHLTTYNKGMRYPEDVFIYDSKRPGHTGGGQLCLARRGVFHRHRRQGLAGVQARVAGSGGEVPALSEE